MNIKRVKRGIMIFCAVIILLLPSGTVHAAKKVKLNRTNVNLYVGETVKLQVKGTSNKVKWSTNKKSVAAVSKNGVVKAKKKGNAKISAKAGKKKYTCKVTVHAPYLNDLSKTMYVGDKTHLTLHGTKKNQVVAWNSLNESVAKISDEGLLEAVGAGETYIEADLYDADIIIKCKITVLANQALQQPGPVVTDAPVVTASPTAANYTLLANYLVANGKTDKNGDYYKSDYMGGDEFDTYCDITYSPSSSIIRYTLSMETDSSETYLFFNVNMQNPEVGELHFVFTPIGSTQDYIGIKNVALSSVTLNNTITGFDSYNFSIPSILEIYNKLAGTTLDLGMIHWKSIVADTGLGLTMNSLGFTSYVQ